MCRSDGSLWSVFMKLVEDVDPKSEIGYVNNWVVDFKDMGEIQKDVICIQY